MTNSIFLFKVINIITLAHNKSTKDIVKENLDKALNILRSTELYNPSNLENDKQTNDLVNGLMTVSFGFMFLNV